jgi:hexosaminidase
MMKPWKNIIFVNLYQTKYDMRAPVFLILFLLFKFSDAQELCPVIPQPVNVSKNTGQFLINKHTVIVAETASLAPLAHYFQKELLKTLYMPLSTSSGTAAPAIRLLLNPKKNAAAESYTLEIKPQEIRITAKEPSGVFYGIVSLLQIARQAKSQKETLLIDGWKLQDEPVYGWRGLMLDESRHFFGMEKVKSLLDWMAFYKLNKLHWHLTDEPGWRIEIKRYPKLSLVGGIGDFHDENAPTQYYTQDQISEIVSYAAERFITVIPEIDMPGHATAANRAYPEFTGGGSPGHPDFTFHPGRKETYTYLSNILRETNSLFPSGMIHLGGDEVSFGNQKWAGDLEIQTMMKANQLANVKEVETYFMKRMGDSLIKMNSQLLVWDEMAEASLPKDKTIMFWWRHDKPGLLKTAFKNGYSVVLCPRLPFYFDFVQDSTHTYGRKWGKQYNPLESVYDFSLKGLDGVQGAEKQILGIQGNLWTETVQDEKRIDYLLFPRISALSEAAWSAAGKRNFPDFMNRLKGHIPLYRQAGIYYFDPFATAKNPEPVRIGSPVKRVSIEE